MRCKKNEPYELSISPRSGASLITVFAMLKWGGIVLLLLNSVAEGHSIQSIDSEAQFASILCRNPKDEAANDLLDKNAQLINANLWSALLNCASAAQRQGGSPAKSIEIYKLGLRVADRLNKPELRAASYYYVGRTYSEMNDFENSIQAYETSRKLFEQAGSERNLSHVLADLGGFYLAAEDYEKAQSYSEQSLTIAEQTKSSLTRESLGPIEYARARSLQTLGQIDLNRGSHAEALNKLGEALALFERLNGTGSSYNIRMADVLIALAKVYGEIGDYGRAFTFLTKAHQVSRSSGDQNTRANIMSNQASLFLEQEDYVAAQTYFNGSLAIYRRLGNARQEARVLLNLAITEQRQDCNDDALRLFQRSMERAHATNLVEIEIAAGEGTGVVLTAKRDFPNALQAINQSLGLARRVNTKTLQVELLWRAAQTYYAMQD